jgi:general secretion pathway protein D
MNSLLVVSASPRTLEDVERWIGELDREPTGTSRAVHLYRVRHGKARDVMEILDRLYPGKTVTPVAKTTEFKPKVAEPAGKQPPAAPAPAPRAEPKPAVPQEGTTTTFDIILDEPLNALIIRGSASEFAAILDTLRTIDVYPRQVLLEVLIAEVQLDDSLKLGIDWNYVTSQSGGYLHSVSLATSAAKITSGLKYVVDKTDRLTAALRSLANDGKVSVLSSPSVISTNGKKSKIDVSDQVPIVTGKVTNPGLEQFITETVEYRDVGILLSFTPYINDEGIVTLEISQEVSEVKTTSVGASANPSFFKRSVDTTLIATQDRSIVLGGLVKERRERTRDGIPFLYKIPVFGWIFGARSSVVSRTELLIFITPRVIASIDEGTRLSREFEDRVEELKMRIWEVKGIKPLKKDDSEER